MLLIPGDSVQIAKHGYLVGRDTKVLTEDSSNIVLFALFDSLATLAGGVIHYWPSNVSHIKPLKRRESSRLARAALEAKFVVLYMLHGQHCPFLLYT